MSSNTSEEVFEYMGNGQCVPNDVVSVRFHPSVNKIDERAFKFHLKLKEVVFNEGLVEIGKCAFFGCESLTSITLPSTVTSIGDEAFCECFVLREAVLNEGLEEMGSFAFNQCRSLESITIPSKVVEIDKQSFGLCKKLNEIYTKK